MHFASSDLRHTTRHTTVSYECVCLSLSFATHYCIRLKSARVLYRNDTILCLHRRKEDHKSWLFDTATREKDDSRSVKLVVVVSKTRGGEWTKDVWRDTFFLWAFISRNVA